MKVREYIQELQKLDQDRNIWCIAGDQCVRPIPPRIELALDGDERLFREDGLKKGDYIISEMIQ